MDVYKLGQVIAQEKNTYAMGACGVQILSPILVHSLPVIVISSNKFRPFSFAIV